MLARLCSVLFKAANVICAFVDGGWILLRVSVQLGDQSFSYRNTPISVSGLSNGVAFIAVGSVRCCVLCHSFCVS
jgi:hypothetical protein